MFGLVLGALSIGTSLLSTRAQMQGIAQQQQANEQVAAYNARVAENDAIRIEMERRENLSRRRAENKRYLSSQRAAIAASGVTMEGSPLEAMTETAAQLELAALDEARAAETQAQARRTGADITRLEAGARSAALDTQRRSTLLSGVSNVAGSLLTFGQQGVFGG